MSKVVKGSFELMKRLNIEAILNVIKNNGSLSRADIAKLTGLTPASVTNITKILIESDYLVEKGIGESSGGRPPIILEINESARFVLGVNIGIGIIDVVLTNLEAEIISRKSISIEECNVIQEKIFGDLINLINEVVDNAKVDKKKILGVGVAMHGVVNPKSGLSQYAPYYKWENVNVKEELESKLEYHVFVDNDVRAMALGESWFGKSKEVSNFITINVSNGVGAGIIIDGKPYLGVDYSAGEIGHLVVEPDGGKCNCGNYGCLETIASNKSIERKVIRSIKQGVRTCITNIQPDIELISIDDICNAADINDALAIEVLKDAAKYIGIGISSLVNILNPSEIILVGEIFERNKFTIETLDNVVKRRGFKNSINRVRLLNSSLGKDAAVIGAATMIIQEVFKGKEFM